MPKSKTKRNQMLELQEAMAKDQPALVRQLLEVLTDEYEISEACTKIQAGAIPGSALDQVCGQIMQILANAKSTLEQISTAYAQVNSEK